MIAEFFEKINRNGLIVRLFCYIFAAGVLVYTLFFVHHAHPHTWLEANVPAFWTIFTLIACVVLVGIARLYGAAGIKRKEDYYDI
jgi:hypothetical protein